MPSPLIDIPCDDIFKHDRLGLEPAIISRSDAILSHSRPQAIAKVIAALDAGESPFDEPWERWRPDPGWTAPGLPDGWSDLCRYPARGGDFRGMLMVRHCS
jgi:hypothetical protein